ncbi:MAG: ribokinase [Planctomycetes bacterium]|nr:ribokinase [Planctomycetota bacterium]
MTEKPRILICGSINMDLVVRTAELPSPGQTRMAHSLEEVSGGKGANQAVAASRLGANVCMLGCIGSDGFAATLKGNLAREGVDTAWVRNVPGPSGVAIVAVDDAGENSIMVVPGSNGLITPSQIDQSIRAIREAEWIVLQLEIPIDSVKHAIIRAKDLGKKVVLNPAPCPSAFDPELFEVDLLCPNQTEAESLLGIKIETIDDARAAALSLQKRGATNVVITLGSQGAVVTSSHDGSGTTWIPPARVNAVDTTAAGDAFIGAMVTQLANGSLLVDACTYAAAAAAYAVTIPGAQPSLPTTDQVLAILSAASTIKP